METFRIEGEIFERLARIVPANYLRKLVSEFGTIAVNFSKERFVKKDWKNQVSEKWIPRKRHDRGSLMARTGRLKYSIRKMSSGLNYVIIGSDVPYAKVHNKGGTHNLYCFTNCSNSFLIFSPLPLMGFLNPLAISPT